MSLAAGSKLGSYEVLAPLGRGGMGEVYRARDSKLGRDVAIKALPESFAADPERLARFEREARLLASLSHPNVAGIHGLEEIERRRYLVLELVDGESLAQRLARGALPVAETLDVARQIAAALEAAHERGIVHRDLKPGNVMLGPDGTVKVLDFGLAKGGVAASSLSGSDLSQSPTMTVAATQAGVVLGTAAYMSPEQARGRSVDRRTDIWSFGCVVYECLTGRQAFEGETVSDLVARILERDPDWAALPRDTPPRLVALLRRCLRKDARERLRDIGDARIELAEIAAGAPDPAAAPKPTVHAPRRYWLELLGPIVGAVIAVLASRWIGGAPPQPLHFSIVGPAGLAMSEESADAAISPDGRTICFCAADSSGTVELWLRSLDALTARALPGTEGARQPFWAPNSRDLAYFTDGSLKRIGVTGDNGQVICPAPNPRGGAWGKGDVIVFAATATGPLLRVPASGGTPRAVTALDSTRHETAHRFPSFLPDGRHFLFVTLPGNGPNYDTWVADVDGRRGARVASGTSVATYAKPGYLVFTRQGTVFAQRFSAWTLTSRGTPRAVRDLRDVTGAYTGAPCVSASRDGALVQADIAQEDQRIDVLDRTGHRIGGVPLPRGFYLRPQVSPDGRLLTAAYAQSSSDRIGPLVVDLVRGVNWRIATSSPIALNPTWTPDGARIVYGADTPDSRALYVCNADGSGAETKLGEVAGLFNDPSAVTPDGRTVIYRSLSGETGEDLWTIPLDGGGGPRALLRTPANEINAQISPDGRWFAYRSDESGTFQVYVQSFPAADRKFRVSVDGTLNQTSASPELIAWRRDGRELIFIGRDAATVMAADVTPGPVFASGTPHALFRLPRGTTNVGLSPDAQRFYVVLPNGAPGRPQMNVLLHWAGELEHAAR